MYIEKKGGGGLHIFFLWFRREVLMVKHKTDTENSGRYTLL